MKRSEMVKLIAYYLAENEHLISISSYLQGPFVWEPENDS